MRHKLYLLFRVPQSKFWPNQRLVLERLVRRHPAYKPLHLDSFPCVRYPVYFVRHA